MRWIALFAIAGLLLTVGVAGADTYGSLAWDWSGASFYPDPFDDDADNGLPSQDGRDIYAGMWWDRDATYDYFRLDLAGTPQLTDYDWAEVYGVYMDGVGGGSPAGTVYTPNPLVGIDWIVDMHPNTAGTIDANIVPNEIHFHAWNGSGWTTVGMGASEYLMRIGEAGAPNNSLQWRIDTSLLSNVYEFTGATHDLSSGELSETYDITETERVPEPATMALMGLGLAGLAAFRKRRQED